MKKEYKIFLGIIVGLLLVISLGVNFYTLYNKETNCNCKNECEKQECNCQKCEKTECPACVNEVESKETNDITISKKLVSNLSCKNSETTFNNISIILEQNNDDLCFVKKFTINGKDIKSEISSRVDSYEIFDKSVIIMSGDTSGNGLYIYNTSNGSMTKLYPGNLEGYWPKSYTTNNNEIIINGVGCGEQCGYSESEYNKKATFKMTYTNGSFSSPKLVN